MRVWRYLATFCDTFGVYCACLAGRIFERRDEYALIVRPVAVIIRNYKLPDFEPAELQERGLKPIDSIDFIGRIEAVPCYRTFGRTGD